MEENKANKNKISKIVIASLLGVNLAITGVLLGLQIHSSVLNNNYQTKYTLYIGTNDKNTYKLEIPFEQCVSKVTEICVKYVDGCTIYEANGYWKDEKSEITNERTIACVLESVEKETVYKICDEVIIALNQNSILVETNNVTSTFYSSAAK